MHLGSRCVLLPALLALGPTGPNQNKPGPTPDDVSRLTYQRITVLQAILPGQLLLCRHVVACRRPRHGVDPAADGRHTLLRVRLQLPPQRR